MTPLTPHDVDNITTQVYKDALLEMHKMQGTFSPVQQSPIMSPIQCSMGTPERPQSMREVDESPNMAQRTSLEGFQQFTIEPSLEHHLKH